ncbi:MAG: DUF6324 family protein [Pikeienuella sp.]
MSINKQTEQAADLQIGPTSMGMVRIYVETETSEIPMDFDPEEAEEIADELRAAAAHARRAADNSGGKPSGKSGGKGKSGSKKKDGQ